MLDDCNVFIPADAYDILNILRMQSTVYVNRTEYRVLTIERANNDSDVVGTNPLEGISNAVTFESISIAL